MCAIQINLFKVTFLGAGEIPFNTHPLPLTMLSVKEIYKYYHEKTYLHFSDDIHSIYDLTENNMFTIQPEINGSTYSFCAQAIDTN